MLLRPPTRQKVGVSEFLIERNIPVDFLVYRPEEFEKRLEMGDPFLKAILKEGKVLYG